MEVHSKIKALAEKIDQLREQINTEEATKTAFVLPFISLLGYDIFNPTEVVPEFTADLGLKKGEKVDYAILQKGEPILIIECKSCNQDINIHGSQLFRYFHVTKTRFALITNGIDFSFYTDLEAPNKMDEKPFLEFSLASLKDSTINEIAKFHKSHFDVDTILDNASSLKYIKELKKLLATEFSNPSIDFVRHYANQVYSGRLTEKVLAQFKELVQKALNQFVTERVNDRLTTALSKEAEIEEAEENVQEVKSKVITTDEELEGYHIVVAILRRKIDKERVVHRDTQSYFGILLDDNNRKPICRLHLNGNTKYISLFDKEKEERKEKISSVDDIYQYEKALLKTVEYYDSQ